MTDSVQAAPAKVKATRAEARARLESALLAFRKAKRSFRASGSENKRHELEEAAGALSDAFDAHPAPRPMLRCGGLVYAWNRATLRRFVEIAPWKAEDVEPMAVRLVPKGREYELWHGRDDGVVLLAMPRSSIYCAMVPGTGPIDSWLDDEERERRIAAGADPGKELSPVSESPYAREFRAMRNRWFQLKSLFVVG